MLKTISILALSVAGVASAQLQPLNVNESVVAACQTTYTKTANVLEKLSPFLTPEGQASTENLVRQMRVVVISMDPGMPHRADNYVDKCHQAQLDSLNAQYARMQNVIDNAPPEIKAKIGN